MEKITINVDYDGKRTNEFMTNNMDFIKKEKEILKIKDKHSPFQILEKIFNKNQDFAFGKTIIKPKNSDLLNIVAHPANLFVAYEKVKKNSGAMTEAYEMSKGSYAKLDEEQKAWVSKTFDCPDGISKKLIYLTGKLIRKNKYPWGCGRRIFLDKPGKKNKKRPITLPPFMDKVVQESLALVLNAVYEPYFEKLNCSFGFRANKGVHDAIVSLTNSNSIGLNMVLEGDIQSAYDRVSRDKLVSIIGEKITDRKLLNFIKKRLDYEIYNTKKKKYEKEELGIPQGGIDSPYLWNIYMSIFDEHIIKSLTEKFEKINLRVRKNISKKQILDKEKRALTRQRATVKSILIWIKSKKGETREKIVSELEYLSKRTAKEIIKEKILNGELNSFKKIIKICEIGKEKDLKKIIKNLFKLVKSLTHKIHKTPTRDPNRIRWRFIYVRYADDFILLTNAKKNMLEKIKLEIASFLQEELKVELSLEKTLITDIRISPAHFLGFEIKTYKKKKIGRYKSKKGKKTINIKATTAGYKVFAVPDRQRLLSRLYRKGYCNKNGFPREINFLAFLEDFSIIERFNSVLTGLANYYVEFIRNPKKNLARWFYIIRYACIKTLAQKHKLSIRKIFIKYKAQVNPESKSKMKTIMSKVQNIINGEIFEKTWTLKTPEKLIEKAFELKRKEKLYGIYWTLRNGSPVLYTDKEKSRITNDNFFEKLLWINLRTMSSFDLPCCICGSEENIEMHHIKHVRKRKYSLIKKELTWMQAMSIRNRKQIPLCSECHIHVVHKGKYGGTKLSYLAPKIMYDNRIITIESHINKQVLNKDKESIKHTKEILENKGWKKIECMNN